jgi:hypothetical protein
MSTPRIGHQHDATILADYPTRSHPGLSLGTSSFVRRIDRLKNDDCTYRRFAIAGHRTGYICYWVEPTSTTTLKYNHHCHGYRD